MTQALQEARDAIAAVQLQTRAVDLFLAVVVTFMPPAAFALGIWLWYRGVLVPGPVEFATMLLLHALSITGVELGFHRLFAHRSYKASRGLKVALACLGSLAFQGPAIWWASIHRKHHRYSDQEGDPHSMYLFDPEGKCTLRGAVHAHIGWIWSARSVGRGGFARYARDLYLDRDLFRVHMSYPYFMLTGFALPALVSGLVHGSWQGALCGLLWGGFARIFFANHLTYWCINSVTHGVGSRAYCTNDRSTNLPALALFTLGQSWHNNHHAFPASSVMGHRPGELDPGAWLLRLFCKLGWVHRMIVPRPELMERKRLRPENLSYRPMRETR